MRVITETRTASNIDNNTIFYNSNPDINDYRNININRQTVIEATDFTEISVMTATIKVYCTTTKRTIILDEYYTPTESSNHERTVLSNSPTDNQRLKDTQTH